MSEDFVRIEGISKTFGTASPALDQITAQIKGGEITGLVGPDGAGKTTLIRLMTGLLLPDQGTLSVLGFDTRTDAGKIQAAQPDDLVIVTGSLFVVGEALEAFGRDPEGAP